MQITLSALGGFRVSRAIETVTYIAQMTMSGDGRDDLEGCPCSEISTPGGLVTLVSTGAYRGLFSYRDC